MALNIKGPEANRLARELAAETGESIRVATRLALAERLERTRARDHRPVSRDELQALIDRGRQRETLDQRPVDELLGYDSHGLPSCQRERHRV